MLTFDDVAGYAATLPHTTERLRHGNRTWFVAEKALAWERPFSKADITRFAGAPIPEAPILALRVENLLAKEATLAAHPGVLFTIPHFEGYAAVLSRLADLRRPLLHELLLDAWYASAPKRLVAEFEATRAPQRGRPTGG